MCYNIEQKCEDEVSGFARDRIKESVALAGSDVCGAETLFPSEQIG